MSLSDLAAATGNLDFGGYKGVNVADPGADQDAATKKYHDDHKYTDAEAVTAMGVKADTNPLHHDKIVIDAVHVYPNYIFPTTSGGYWVDWRNDAYNPYDYGDLWDTAQSTRITIKKDGLYLIHISGYWAASAAGAWRAIYLYVNGVFHSYLANSAAPTAALPIIQTFSRIAKLSVNDYLTVFLYQDTGGNLNFDANGPGYGIWATMLRET